MTCPSRPGCGLAVALEVTPALRVWQTFYCESGWQRCERLKRSRAGNLVPPNLLPNGTWLGLRPPGAPGRGEERT